MLGSQSQESLFELRSRQTFLQSVWASRIHLSWKETTPTDGVFILTDSWCSTLSHNCQLYNGGEEVIQKKSDSETVIYQCILPWLFISAGLQEQREKDMFGRGCITSYSTLNQPHHSQVCTLTSWITIMGWNDDIVNIKKLFWGILLAETIPPSGILFSQPIKSHLNTLW